MKIKKCLIAMLILPLLLVLASCDGGGENSPVDTSPGEVTSLETSFDNQRIRLIWEDPSDPDFDHVLITWSPTGTAEQTISSGIESFTATGLTNGTEYTFTVQTVDSTGKISTGVQIKQKPYAAGHGITCSVNGTAFTMRCVPAKQYYSGVYVSINSEVTRSFAIADTEVTYELWKNIYDWAIHSDRGAGRYYFQNPGEQGNYYDSTTTNQHPVMSVSWRDAMVWCNALSEYYNEMNGTSLECAYRASGSPIRDSRDANASVCDAVTAYINTGGFRLPARNEWELAATYIIDSNDDGDVKDAGEYYPATHVSGDTTNPCYSSSGATISTIFGNYAWYSDNSVDTSHPVKTKSANAMNIYDMCGNADEWLFDISSGTGRCQFQGHFHSTTQALQLGYISSSYPYSGSYTHGFRIAMKP